MGKVKQHRVSPRSASGKNGTRSGKGVARRQHSQNVKANPPAKPALTRKPNVSQQSRPRIPFSKYDQVLLVGEGDFSFTLSLAKNHDLGSIVATSYDDKETLGQKYPRISDTLLKLLTSREMAGETESPEHELEWQGFSSSDGNEAASNQLSSHSSQITILHGIDATSLSKAHRKVLSPHVPFNKIVFNFPHTGGLSTDVNRQVRANQELLVGFFNASKTLLATKSRPAKSTDIDDEFADQADMELIEEAEAQKQAALATGQILVTLFEGEPYSLWNIRDLARHCGLQVVESFKFPWLSYPGYTHARTVGDIKTGKDRSDEGKRKGAWRGEEREARCYVLALKEDLQAQGKGKRKRTHQSDSEASD